MVYIPKDSPNEVMDEKDVMDYLNISRYSLRRYKLKGMPFHKRDGIKSFFLKSEIDEWITKR